VGIGVDTNNVKCYLVLQIALGQQLYNLQGCTTLRVYITLKVITLRVPLVGTNFKIMSFKKQYGPLFKY
jgi:hypothetical protein